MDVRHRGAGLFAILLIVLATVLTYWPVTQCGYTVRDDDHTVSQNPHLKPPSLSGVLRYWKRPSWGLYTPITYTVWSGIALLSPAPALPSQPYQLNPLHFHTANLIVHVMCALAAYFVLRRLFAHVWAACAGALVFALHPLQVDPVAWVSGLKDLLAGLFALLAIWQYLLSADDSLDASDRKFHFALCLIAALIAVLSKVSAAMLPGVLLIIDSLLLRRPLRHVIRGIVPVLIVVLPALILARFVQGAPILIALWQRPLLVLFTLTFYFWKIVWPVGLAPDYGLTPQVALHVNWIWLCWIVPPLVAIALWLVRRRRPELPAGVLVFVVSILPVLGFVPFGYQTDSTVADHYLYLAMLGIGLAVAGTLARATASTRVASIAVTSIVLLALAVLAFRQTWYWQNTYTLFTHNAQVTPDNWRPINHIGLALLDQKKPAEAEARFLESIKIERTHVNVGNLAAARLAQGDLPGAIKYMNESAQLMPTMAAYQVQLADLYLRANRPADAEEHAQRAIELKPDDPNAPRLLAEARKRFGKR
jgi:Flp pilus assembly protein TadD